MNLNEYLEEYRALTLDLMEEIQKSGQIKSLVKERAEIIDIIKNSNFDKEKIKSIGNSMNLIGLEEELQILYKKEKVKVRKQIEKIKIARKINNNYSNNIGNISRVFNKSV